MDNDTKQKRINEECLRQGYVQIQLLEGDQYSVDLRLGTNMYLPLLETMYELSPYDFLLALGKIGVPLDPSSKELGFLDMTYSPYLPQ